MTKYTDTDCQSAVELIDSGYGWPDLEREHPGIQAAVRRYQAKLRTRNSRASAEQRIE